MSTDEAEVLRHGCWKYGPKSLIYVWIIRQRWDQYHEDFHEEPPDLNDKGWAYYALYGQLNDRGKHTGRSRTFLSESEAVSFVQSMYSVEWD